VLTSEQIQARKRGVGCSEILAALGKDPRCSRLELYKRKLGELPDVDLSDDERVQAGAVLEPGIRELFSRKLGFPIVKRDDTLFHPEIPLVGHPDGFVLFEDEPGIEFKNRDRMVFKEEYGEDWTDQVPVRDLVQCMGYMMLTKRTRWLLGAFVGGNERHIFQVNFDAQLAEAIDVGVRNFWSHVEQRRPPDPETPEDVAIRWPKDIGATVIATHEVAELCAQLAQVKADIKAAEEHEAHLKSQIQMFMQDSAQLVDADGRLLATWKTAKASKKFDTKRFEAEHPALFTQYLREQPGSRRFLLK
jgi:predicted phage-related endonuclease